MEIITSFLIDIVVNFIKNIFILLKRKVKDAFARTLNYDCRVGQINLGYPEGNCYLFGIEKREYILNIKELKKKIPLPIRVDKARSNPDSSNMVLSLIRENDNNPIDNINYKKEEEILINLTNKILIDILSSFYLRNNSSEKLFRFIAEKLKKKNLSLTLYFSNTNMMLFNIPFNNLEGKDFGFPDKLITIVSKSK